MDLKLLFEAIANGTKAGYKIIDKFGINEDIDTGSDPEDVCFEGGLYAGFPDTADELEIISTAPNDSSAGTGARTVTVSGLLDENGNRMPDVTVTMNGTTAVNINPGQTYLRSNRGWVASAGSNDGALGNITLRAVNDNSIVFWTFNPNYNQTTLAALTIPLNEDAYIYEVYCELARASGAAGSATVALMRKDVSSNVLRALYVFEVTDSLDVELNLYQPPIHLGQMTDIVWRVLSVSDNNTIISAGLRGYTKEK